MELLSQFLASFSHTGLPCEGNYHYLERDNLLSYIEKVLLYPFFERDNFLPYFERALSYPYWKVTIYYPVLRGRCLIPILIVQRWV